MCLNVIPEDQQMVIYRYLIINCELQEIVFPLVEHLFIIAYSQDIKLSETIKIFKLKKIISFRYVYNLNFKLETPRYTHSKTVSTITIYL